MIEQAKSSIWIFTPYLDFTLNKLLSKSLNDIEIVIITSLEGENPFLRGSQLKALKELISNGVVIKNLSGLHAKILLVDNNYISLGSQNFTSRGRKNKEAGFQSNTSFLESDILQNLNDWHDQANIVNAELIDTLIEYVKVNEDELAELKKRLEEDLESIINKFTNEESNFTITESEHYNTIFRYAQSDVIVYKKLSGIYKNYFSFKVDAPNDLSQWIKIGTKGEEEKVSLPAYFYFPSLNSKTMQMAFLRVHITTITYMKSEFHMNFWSGFDIKGKRFTVDFKFLKTKCKEANIKITLSSGLIGKVNLYYLFNAIEFKLVKSKFSNNVCEKFINDNLLNKPRKMREFLYDKVRPQKFTTKQDQPEEIEKFLPKDSYELGIMEFQNQPILIFEEY
tara:strand:- start:2333 stop:3517 length:1185 start_codon:yes stop_codon:yes gene_type:complete